MKKILLTLLFAPIFAIATFAQAQTNLVITEIYYNMPGPGVDSLEFIEIHNPSTAAVSLKNYTFRTAVTDTFPDVNLAAGGYYTVAFNAKYFKKIFGTDPGHQWRTIAGGTNGLNNTGERVDLYDAAGVLLDSVRYVADVPWPSLANGGGPSLVYCDLTKDNGNGANWLVSSNKNTATINGISIYASPGKEDCKGTPPGGAVTAQSPALNTNKATPLNVNISNLIIPNTATVTITQQPKGGTFQKAPVGTNTYIYAPGATYCGTDTVKYKAVVGTEMATGVITIKVNCPPSVYPKYTIGKVTLDANADLIPDSTGVYCDIEGVIHSPNYATPTGALPGIQFCIIDAAKKEDGIIVNRTGKIFGYGSPKEGDKVRVWGRISQLSGATIITPDSIFASGTAPVFAPTVITKLDESTESMLVEIKGLTLSNQAQWGAGGANPTGYTLTTSDGTNTYTVRVDRDIADLFNSGGPKTKKFDIIGIGFQFVPAGGGGGGGALNTGYQIMPRKLSDMKWQVATNDVALGQNVSVFPNPFNTDITVKLAENVERINVHNTIGQLMFSIEQPSENQVINTTTWSEGMYFITVEKEGRHFTTKIVK